jgi:hypothetical protein
LELQGNSSKTFFIDIIVALHPEKPHYAIISSAHFPSKIVGSSPLIPSTKRKRTSNILIVSPPPGTYIPDYNFDDPAALDYDLCY